MIASVLSSTLGNTFSQTDPRVIASECAVVAFMDLARNGQAVDVCEVMEKAMDLLPPNSTNFERGLAAGMAITLAIGGER